MRGIYKAIGAFVLFGAGLALAAAPRHAAPRLEAQSAEPMPAFHAQAPKAELPPVMNPKLFDDILVQNSYVIASRIKKTLYQEPCYCHCDRSQGHSSLLDCFVSRHASACDICMREAFYSYEQGKKGKTASQIREGIVKGDFQQMDISKYEKPLPAK